ncbi:MAG: serine/threonine-protein kinase, partial [Pyrinomonadaceae bacterium]
MTSEQWQRVKTIVHQALETEPQKRGRFVAEKCGDDAAVRNEVDGLLATNESIGHFIETPAFVQVMTTLPIEEPAPELTPGQKLGHYEVIRELGRGGMGTVYLAQDNELGRKVALKVLPSGFDDRSAAARRFRQEARVLSALNHPNILTIHEIGHSDPIDFIATELVDGVTLRQRISDGPIGLAEAIEVAVQVTAALAEAHAAGIIHRDIKPENIMIRRDGLVKVLDFGIAKLADTQDASTGITSLIETNGSLPAGTPKYMSPEQLRGQPADAGSDVWSFGILLNEMLTGRVPLDGVVHDDLNLSNSPLGNSEAAGELHRVISRCLERDAVSRYRSAAELLHDLKGLKRSIRDVVDAAEANPVRLTGSVKLNEWKMLIAVAALVIITALAGTYFYFAGQQRTTIDSIAVMPFVNASGDADTEYLSDGITE